MATAGMSTQAVEAQLQNVAQAALSGITSQTIVPTLTGNTSSSVISQAGVDSILTQMQNIRNTAAALNTALESAGTGLRVNTVLTINAAPPAAAAVTAATTTLPQAVLAGAVTNSINQIAVNTGVATLTIVPGAIPVSEGQTLELSTSRVDTSSMTPAQQASVGNAPVFSFSIRAGDTALTSFAQPLGITVPYTPASGEDTSRITVYYIRADGSLENVSGTYDASSGTVSFTTPHLSEYVIKVNNVTFSDVDSSSCSWAKDAIEAMAAKGIINGMGAGQYMPGNNVTRAQFSAMLVNSLKLSDSGASNPFSDVSVGAWYYKSVVAAVKAGLISGKTASTFAPDDYITRQEMSVMLARALQKVKGKTVLKTNKSIEKFSDVSKIADYAKASVAMTIDYSIMNGMESGLFVPEGLATRAQAAVVISKLFGVKQ